MTFSCIWNFLDNLKSFKNIISFITNKVIPFIRKNLTSFFIIVNIISIFYFGIFYIKIYYITNNYSFLGNLLFNVNNSTIMNFVFNIIRYIEAKFPSFTINSISFFNAFSYFSLLHAYFSVVIIWIALILYKLLKQKKEKNINTTYQVMIALASFSLTIFLICHIDELSRNDKLFFQKDTIVDPQKNKTKLINNELSKLFIVEIDDFTINSFEKYVVKNRVGGLFISPKFIDKLHQKLNGRETISEYLLKLKKDYGIQFYMDIESYYPNLKNRLPRQMALATSWDLDEVYSICFNYAVEIKNKYLIDYVFGPVLDRKMSPNDNTILTRTFGTNSNLNYMYSCALILGFQDAEIECIPKHFPGHPQLEKKGTNPHYNLVITQYSEEMLESNLKPFKLVIKNKFLNINKFMTDHIIIPKISKKIPYTIFKNGVSEASKNLTNKKIFFISDDLRMLSRVKNKGKRNINCNVKYLAKISIEAFLSGHTMNLIRGLKPLEFENIINSIKEKITRENELTINNQIQHANNFRNKSLSKKFLKNKIENVFNHFVNINTSNEELKGSGIVNLIEEKKLIIFSSFWEKDDFSPIFGSKRSNMVYPLKRSNINYIDKVKSVVSMINSNTINLSKYDYIIIGIDGLEMNKIISTIYKILSKKNITDKLIVFIQGTPDMLYLTRLEYLNKIKPIDIYVNCNVYAIFANTKENLNDLRTTLENNKFANMKKLSELTIDLPDYYYFDTDFNGKLKYSIDMKKIVFGASSSSLISNYSIIILYSHLLSALFILFFLKYINIIIKS